MTKMPIYWNKYEMILYKMYSPTKTEEESMVAEATKLYEEFIKLGCVKSRLPLEMLELHPLIIHKFYSMMAKKNKGIIETPLKDKEDSKWMQEIDFSFVNVRASASKVNETGRFLSATSLLPVIRAKGIHLAPFFQSIFEIVYAQSSLCVVSDEVTNHEVERLGMSRYDQVRYFVDCCHILGKVIGVDFTAHTAGLSRVCFDKPEVFRWVKFHKGFDCLYNNQSLEEQYSPKGQAIICKEIIEIVMEIKKKYGIEILEDINLPINKAEEIMTEIRETVVKEGYFPVPPHTWNGVGVPGVGKYLKKEGYPEWIYKCEEGKDQGQHAIGLHATFLFYHNLPVNDVLDLDNIEEGKEPYMNKDAMKYMQEFFPYMHKEYKFDFIRIDYIDHLFDGLRQYKGKDLPICEKMTPDICRAIKNRAKEVFKPVGMLADHFSGLDIDDYYKAGFDLIIGNEVLAKMDKENVENMFKNNKELYKVKKNTEVESGNMVYAIDTHDMANPLLFGVDLADREGVQGIILRHFFSRFAAAGIGYRPKYEIMGNQDASVGINKANNYCRSIEWGNSKETFDTYNQIEDIFNKNRKWIMKSKVIFYKVEDEYVYWIISSQEKMWILSAFVNPNNYGCNKNSYISIPDNLINEYDISNIQIVFNWGKVKETDIKCIKIADKSEFKFLYNLGCINIWEICKI